MRTVQSALAPPALRLFVRAFAQRTATGLIESQPMPAYLEMSFTSISQTSYL